MGSIHNELRSSTLQQAIRDAVGGNMDVEIERLGETLTPVLDIWTKPEWSFLRAERLWCTGDVPLAANVAGFGRFQLSNPTGSRTIVVVEQLSVMDTTGTTSYIVTDAGAFIAAGLAPCTARDTRWQLAGGGGSRPTTVQQTVDNTAGGTSGIHLEIQNVPAAFAVVNFNICLPFVLQPGDWLQIQATVVNHAQRFQASGYERVAFSGEL